MLWNRKVYMKQWKYICAIQKHLSMSLPSHQNCKGPDRWLTSTPCTVGNTEAKGKKSMDVSPNSQ